MGWTSGQLDGPFTSRAAIEFKFGAEFMPRVIDCARIGTTIYAAIRDKTDPQAVWGLVLLAERQDGTLYTKPIDETMGPAEEDCPARILALLTDTESEMANEWRARCRERLARRKLKAGDIVAFDSSFCFSDGSSGDTFVFVGGVEFKTPNGKPCRLQNWKRSKYTVIS